MHCWLSLLTAQEHHAEFSWYSMLQLVIRTEVTCFIRGQLTNVPGGDFTGGAGAQYKKRAGTCKLLTTGGRRETLRETLREPWIPRKKGYNLLSKKNQLP